MGVIESLLSTETQQEYRAYYLSRHAQKDKVQAFVDYFDGPLFPGQLAGLIDGSWVFSIPSKRWLNAKRFCFVYPSDQVLLIGYLNYVLGKAVADKLPDVYSRSDTRGLHYIIKQHLNAARTPGSVVLKGDIQSFSNTIRRDVLLKVQEQLLADDPAALDLVERIYKPDTYVEDGEQKSTPLHLFMGTPLDSYSNNTVLYEMDRMCRERSLSYVRFYDDFALVLASQEAACEALREMEQICSTLQLRLHPQKTKIVEEQESYHLLGLKITGTEVTFAPDTIAAFRKRLVPLFRQMVRMVRRGQVEGMVAMAQVIRAIQAYFESVEFKREILPLFQCVTTDDDVRRLDRATVDWLRAIGAGTPSGAKYRISYEQIQALGYKSLVGFYYSHCR